MTDFPPLQRPKKRPLQRRPLKRWLRVERLGEYSYLHKRDGWMGFEATFTILYYPEISKYHIRCCYGDYEHSSMGTVREDYHDRDIGPFSPTDEGFKGIKPFESSLIGNHPLVDLMIYEVEMHQLWLTFRHTPMSIIRVLPGREVLSPRISS